MNSTNNRRAWTRRLGSATVAFLAIMVAVVSMAPAADAVSVKSYNYTDNFGRTGTLSVSSNHTWTFTDTFCDSGVWAIDASTKYMTLQNTNPCDTDVYLIAKRGANGFVRGIGLIASSNDGFETWAAPLAPPPTAPSRAPRVALSNGSHAARPPMIAGTYDYTDNFSQTTQLTLNGDGTWSMSVFCDAGTWTYDATSKLVSLFEDATSCEAQPIFFIAKRVTGGALGKANLPGVLFVQNSNDVPQLWTATKAAASSPSASGAAKRALRG